jgi:hypothetical protein
VPRFQLASDRAQAFEIGDRRYEVPARGVIEIPDELAFVVARRGLPLVAVVEVPTDAPKARVVIEGKPPAALLAQLPAERREDLARRWEDCATQGERSALLRDVQRWLTERAAQDDEEPVETEDDEEPAAAPAVTEDDIDAQLAAVTPRVRRRKGE